ncbi:Ctr-domain-containing protein [Hypoxylon rubiginosum]|uniref:Ctr-domain-containing protein n=1 Tax=Hypoxylon rubiginosum TaxID=110542 RepID=A0ACB9Z185_9PEZI|nr:Ctr-domain-containing protein [Hypoxylon rubiginosum]
MTVPMSTGTMTMSMSSAEHSNFEFTKPTSSAAMGGTDDMGGMGNMGGDGDMGNTDMSGGTCNVSMLWNWNTIDACFLSDSWQIKSSSGFAALCIGAALLVVLMEFLRRAATIYDEQLVRKHQKAATALAATVPANSSSETANGSLIAKEKPLALAANTVPYRPTPWQQAIRALLHTLHFALAYWIMLLAMYYNGYIIICIFLGAFIGFFAFQWEHIGPPNSGEASMAIRRDVIGCHG